MVSFRMLIRIVCSVNNEFIFNCSCINVVTDTIVKQAQDQALDDKKDNLVDVEEDTDMGLWMKPSEHNGIIVLDYIMYKCFC